MILPEEDNFLTHKFSDPQVHLVELYNTIEYPETFEITFEDQVGCALLNKADVIALALSLGLTVSER